MNKHNIAFLKFEFGLTLRRIGNHHPVPRKERETLVKAIQSSNKNGVLLACTALHVNRIRTKHTQHDWFILFIKPFNIHNYSLFSRILVLTEFGYV